MLNTVPALKNKLESMEQIVLYSDTQNHYELRDIQEILKFPNLWFWLLTGSCACY